MRQFTFILSLIVLTLSACTSHVDEQLQSAEDYYIKHRVINDSVNEVLSHIDTPHGSRQDMMKRILQAIHLYSKGELEKAFDAFDALCREMKPQGGGESSDGISPYWHAVVEDYMGFIYLDSGLARQARPHLYNVLHYANMMRDDRAIANAYSHISVYHHTMGQLDSALYYASRPLSCESALDSQMIAIVYHNLAVVQASIANNADNDILGTLQLSKKHNIRSRDSLITSALMSQAYYLKGSLDSARLCQSEVERGQHDIAKLILYKFLADYYDQQSQTDSAYKYVKLCHRMDSVYLGGAHLEPILKIASRHDLEEAEQRFDVQTHSILIIFAILLAIVVLGTWTLHKRQLSKVYKQIESLSLPTGRAETSQATQQSNHHEAAAYASSEICQRLKKKAEAGQSVTPDEWREFEHAVKTISPTFYSKFYSLRKVSDLEYRVCLLVRAQFVPADMAALLCKSRSAISSVRSRLYEKVFGNKGGSRQWDEFILSL